MRQNFKNEFSKKIYFARLNAKLTVDEASFRIGVASRNIRYYESGQKTPRFITIVKICDVYGISIDELVSKDNQ
jgi:transcriptional regulator with XRE-family HTH domain